MHSESWPAVAERITEAKCKETLVSLARIPKSQTDLLEAEPLLREFIRTGVEPRLRAMGIGGIRHDDMGNMVAETGRSASGRALMLVTHAMNQPQATMINAYAGDVEDGTRYDLPGEVVLGKGVSEQKATMAAMLTALEALTSAAPPLGGRLLFLCCVSGESGKHDAIRNAVERLGLRADVAFLGGTSLKMSLGNRGRVDVLVTVKGMPAHSSRPQDGCDAVTGAVELVRMLRDSLDLSQEHPELGRPTLTVTHFRSFPDSTHTVQDRVDLVVDRRLLPGEDPEQAVAEIASVARRLESMTNSASGRSWSVEVERGPFMYPSLTASDGVAASLIRKSCLDVLGYEPECYYSTSAFDQGYLNHIGIEAINWGPGEHRFAHTDLDMASVSRTRDAALVYAHAALGYLG